MLKLLFGLLISLIDSIFALVVFAGMRIIGVFMGGVVGWLIGLLFGPVFLNMLFDLLHLHGYSMFEIGAFFGFLGGFFRVL